MRALVLVTLAACSPDVASGTYLCGPDQACPEGQTCNGADGLCVDPVEAVPFACDPAQLHEPDEAANQGFAVTGLTCVSSPNVMPGCLADGDPANWIQFATPAACASVAVNANIVYAVGFEPLALDLVDVATGAVIDSTKTCTSPAEGGAAKSCLSATLENGKSYGLQIAPTGQDDCDGACNYNRYTLTLQLATP